MKSSFMINIAGPTYYRKAYEKVKHGSILILKKDPDNRHDPYAIKVCLPNGDQVGWVAASPHTLKPGCLNARQAHNLFNDNIEAVVTYISGNSTRLVVNGSNKDFLKYLKKNPAQMGNAGDSCPLP